MTSIGRSILVIVLLAMAVGCSAASQQRPDTLFVSTDGNDDWSGTLPAPNRDGTDGPFASVDRARRAVLALKTSIPASVPPGG